MADEIDNSAEENQAPQQAPASERPTPVRQEMAWIDFSGTENPFGTPDSLVDAVIDSLEQGLISYIPDRDATTLRSVLSRTLSNPAESFLVGTTISDMIGAVSQAFEPCTVGVPIPCPIEYVLTLSNTGHKIERITTPTDFAIPTAEALAEREVKISAALLANPTYPTSRLLPKSVLLSYLNTCDWVIVDERSIELTLGGTSVAPFVQEYKNLVVVQSFSEQYAMSGAHVSYCIAHPDTIAEIRRFYDNSGISLLAEAVAAPSLIEHPKLEGVRGFLYSEIPWMQTMLSLIPGIEIFPAEANYVMCSYSGGSHSHVPDVDKLAKRLEERGLLIRKLDRVPGLSSGDYFCVSVRTRQENEKLIREIRNILS